MRSRPSVGRLLARGAGSGAAGGAGTATPLVAARVEVQGRPAAYATGGEGLPVLFLHGWGLGHDVYHRPLRHLVDRGCRVVAPSLPGFGGTLALPAGRRDLAGYAAWVDAFLAAIAVDGPVVVLGHSFGGGVATRFAHDFPGRTRYLVLLNSVGDPMGLSLSGARAGGARLAVPPVWRWRPSRDNLAAAVLARDRFVRNALRDPLTLVQVGALALTADLRGEMAVLAQRELPVLVLWGERDGLLPLSAFDTACAAFGIDGRTVGGGHSWLLTDPDVFAEVVDNVIRLQRSQHGSQQADATLAQLRELLAATSLPPATVDELVRGVSPTWLVSEPPAVLAADLALCHPPLGDGEVRAVARPMPLPGAHRLTVVAADRPGLLADTAATLAAAGLAVSAASVTTWPGGGPALHALTVHGDLDEGRWRQLGVDLADAGRGRTPSGVAYRGDGPVSVSRDGEASGGAVLRVAAPDGPGLLATVCRWFADQGASIVAAHVDTRHGLAHDVFLVEGRCDPAELARHLEGGEERPPARSRLAAALPCCARLTRRP